MDGWSGVRGLLTAGDEFFEISLGETWGAADGGADAIGGEVLAMLDSGPAKDHKSVSDIHEQCLT